MNDPNTRDSAPTPEPKPPASMQPATHDDIDRLQGSVLDVRDKLLQLREKELFELREKVSGLQQQIRQVVIVGAVIGAAAAFLGIRQFSDIKNSIDTTFKRRVEESVVFYDDLARAQAAIRNNACSSALPVLRELAERRPDEEVVNFLSLHCFAAVEEYDPGYEFLSRLKQKGILRRSRLAITFNNAGWIVCAKAFSDPKFESEARELLRRAEQLYESDNSRDIAFPLYGMALLSVSSGNSSKAKEYADRFQEAVASGGVTDPPDWRDGIGRLWFQALERRRPDVRQELEHLFPKMSPSKQ